MNLPLPINNEIVSMLRKQRLDALKQAEACSILIASLCYVDYTPLYNRRLGQLIRNFGGESKLYENGP